MATEFGLSISEGVHMADQYARLCHYMHASRPEEHFVDYFYKTNHRRMEKHVFVDSDYPIRISQYDAPNGRPMVNFNGLRLGRNPLIWALSEPKITDTQNGKIIQVGYVSETTPRFFEFGEREFNTICQELGLETK